jgi:hypothetical protein
MKYQLTFVFCFIVSLFCFSQHKNNYEISLIKPLLKKKDICLNKYILIDSVSIEEYSEGFTMTNSKDSLTMKELKITNDFSIFTYNFTPTDYEKVHNDSFKINDFNYEIDSLVVKNKINLKYNNPYFYFTNYYIYTNKKNKNEKLILLKSVNRTFYKDRIVESFFVVKISENKTNIQLFYDLSYSNN